MADRKVMLPDELLQAVQQAADAEQRSVDEVLVDAVRKYLDDRKWQQLMAAGQSRARAKGLAEDDVPRAISEARRDRHDR